MNRGELEWGLTSRSYRHLKDDCRSGGKWVVDSRFTVAVTTSYQPVRCQALEFHLCISPCSGSTPYDVALGLSQVYQPQEKRQGGRDMRGVRVVVKDLIW